ncbi:unnamed protein product [Mytilus coruscus]|uniref:HAT C-terminal dimerisation domain-containing protein n=1 Tax=Mytilus coruscus TaxID=42192 RepID=A0A6J8BYF0_MYTCO|nr:unnamed protein product [Mytilus coruscus]
MARRIVERGSSLNPQEIDSGVKNSWKWEWLEKEVAGELVGLHIRKIAEKGKAYCQLCKKDLMYSHRGWKALEQHMQLKVHQDNLKLRKTNYSLSGCFGTKESNVPYGIHPMFKSLSVQQNDAKPVTPLNDRVINTEAMVLGFAADHSLPFSLVPKLIGLSKTLAKDKNCRGHSTAQKYLLRLPSLVTNILAGDEEKEHYELQVRRYQTDDSILLLPDDCRIDHWWANEKHAKVYPLLVKMVQAILTCFHGPQVESSFSVMNDIIDGKSNRMNIEAYNCIQSVKYSLKSSGKSAIQYFTKDDFLHERVDHKLVQNMQSSSRQYQEEVKCKKLEKEEKLSQLQVKAKKKLSKRKAKEIVENAAKKARHAFTAEKKKGSQTKQK